MISRAEGDPIRAAYLLGRAWLDRGQGRIARAQFEKVLELRSEDHEVRRYLAYALVSEGEFVEAARHLDVAAANQPMNAGLKREARLLRDLAGLPRMLPALPDACGGKIRFTSLYRRNHHRSGWRYAMESLYPLHHSEGVLFEGFLEDPFAWQHHFAGIRPSGDLLKALRSTAYDDRLTSEERNIVPYREPWVGFLHNPPNMPSWLHPHHSPQTILAKPIWKDSLKHCAGLFALSETMGAWLRDVTGKPVSVVLHPTEIPPVVFDFERFLANPSKKIVQVGWWLRRLSSIDRLPIPGANALGYRKLRLVPGFSPGSAVYLAKLRARELMHDGLPDPHYAANTEECQHLENVDYDMLLAENIVFVDLYDASANNAVIECLARATPILVNRLPAVEEYLGSGYPLYFSDLDDAAAKALDLERVRAAHDYLLASELRKRLDAESFRRSVQDSEVYHLL